MTDRIQPESLEPTLLHQRKSKSKLVLREVWVSVDGQVEFLPLLSNDRLNEVVSRFMGGEKLTEGSRRCNSG
jgi:hypothetical protein